jgi:hypothetical protein
MVKTTAFLLLLTSPCYADDPDRAGIPKQWAQTCIEYAHRGSQFDDFMVDMRIGRIRQMYKTQQESVLFDECMHRWSHVRGDFPSPK